MAHTLLLADDSVTIQRVIELTFADEDIQVVTVGDGQQAIERIESDPPDIVLADVGMPERDGYEVATHIKRTARLAHIPVLLLTGAFEPVDEARASAAGCDGVLAKPFEPQMVINRVKELLSASAPPRLERRVAPVEPKETRVEETDVASALMRKDLPADQPSPRLRRSAEALRAKAEAGSHKSETPSPTPALSLDDYFDRLDAALGNSGTVSPVLQSLDEEMAGDRFAKSLKANQVEAEPPPAPREPPVRREPIRAPEPPRVEPPTPRPEPRAAVSIDTVDPAPLANAFSTLLAAERGEAIPSSIRVPLRSLFPTLAPSNDELIDQIARRVVDRLSDRQFVSDIVVRVTERIVREEIERLRSALRER